MKCFSFWHFGIFTATSLLFGTAVQAADQSLIENVVNEAVRQVMEENEIPGMTVAITVRGERHVFNYGVASRENGRKVTDNTLFEIGSISKTFTATLASYAEARSALSFSDNASEHLPALAGSSFDRISLLDLGTYTAGGLPLQFPDHVTDRETMIAYYKSWRPAHDTGTQRQYSNPSIGLFGHIAAASLNEPFDELMEETIFPAFGLSSTYIRVPEDRMDDYAYGYSKAGKPIRVTPGVLDSEAYGVKTRSADLIRFVEANMDGSELDETMLHAIASTHTGYYKVGDMVQGLGWEMYAYPATLETLLAGNSSDMALKPNEASKLVPPLAPQRDLLINKTGSTNGFGAYVAFIPARSVGIVMLANKNYPIPARVKVAHRILEALASGSGSEQIR
ncbi:class C beta-lactamase [Aquamicrobium sp. LC103]|uniref:class C beta-lactamase n=1 Tax=Aquamicrobium sp. LC103 TaxID=1120658 RepID=UPI00063E88E0|nr:class C beta-lactamase [Aquamicrobium sp. LC103]TKT74783.1 beta-lactamase [Aquamicrobium sp. LC103]